MNEEILIAMVAILYAFIGGFIVIDVWFGFNPSHHIRKFFEK
jgi:ABC-type uncharacterized transport system permease subunit